MKKSLTIIMLSLSCMITAKAEDRCLTDGCSIQRSLEMKAAMDFASQIGSPAVSYIVEVKRMNDGLFKIVEDDHSKYYVKVKEKKQGSLSYKVTRCFNASFKVISCESLLP